MKVTDTEKSGLSEDNKPFDNLDEQDLAISAFRSHVPRSRFLVSYGEKELIIVCLMSGCGDLSHYQMY